jgi:hypothetical protein
MMWRKFETCDLSRTTYKVALQSNETPVLVMLSKAKHLWPFWFDERATKMI